MRRAFLLLAVMPLLAGCAQIDKAAFDFNLGLARHVLKPMAEGYREAVPEPIRKALRNVTSNVEYTDVFANNLLQGKLGRAHTDLQRIVINTLAFGGLFDAATDIGIPRYDEDFGQTLGVWGVAPGPYFNIPFLGPSTLRDAMQYPFGFVSGPFTYVDATAVSLPLSVATYLFERFDQTDNLKFIDEAVDPYAFVKEGYLEKRLDEVYDGNPPGKTESEDKVIDDALEGLDDDLDDLDDLDDMDEGAGADNADDTGLDDLDDLDGLDDLDEKGAGAQPPQPTHPQGLLPPPTIIKHPRRRASGP